MLLRKSYGVEQTIVGQLSFDDGTVKEYRLSEGDFVTIKWNHAGSVDKITGKISRIEAGTHYTHSINPNHLHQCDLVDTCDKRFWYIIVDASNYNDSSMKKIEIDKILDVEVLKRDESISAVTSPSGPGNITDMRINGNYLELSMDHQKTWFFLCKIPQTAIEVEPELLPIVEKIAATIPSCVSPSDRDRMIVEILKTMKETGQITVEDCDCSCDCCKPVEPPVEEKPPVDEVQNGHMSSVAAEVISILESKYGKQNDPCDHTAEDHATTVAAVLEILKQQGVIKDPEPETPPTTEENPDSGKEEENTEEPL